MACKSIIRLNQLELSVNLGWPQGERIKPQIVTADVIIHFTKPPAACVSDQLTDTHCYDMLIKTIKTEIAARNFRLLEHLGFEIHRIAKQAISAETRIQISITKKPAILNLTGGVTFFYEDE
ncbi:MAG: dihydroneopterin aldolase [Gammaproteobacteria bacterium]